MNYLVRRPSAERDPVRVDDIIIIRDNMRTKDAEIDSEVEELLRGATTFHELRHAAGVAEERLRGLGIFESVDVRVDADLPGLPAGTAIVVIEVSEKSNPFAGKLRKFAKSGGDIWDASLGYGLGVLLSRFEAFCIPLSGGISLISQDWLNFCSYKERALSLSIPTMTDLSYNLSWSSVPSPFQSGYSLLSLLSYSFKIDQRDSRLRPTKGFAFISTTQIGGIIPRQLSLRFFRQEFALRYAIPLGFYGAALNLGASAGVQISSREKDPDKNFGDYRGLIFGALADLSFDLPLKVLRDAGIYGHVSASANTCCLFKGFSQQRLMDFLHHDVRVGVIIPTRLFRMKVNYCHSFELGAHDQGKTGIVVNFSRQ